MQIKVCGVGLSPEETVAEIIGGLRAKNVDTTNAVYALNGSPGSGKSTIAKALAGEVGATIVEGDSFRRTGVEYSPEDDLESIFAVVDEDNWGGGPVVLDDCLYCHIYAKLVEVQGERQIVVINLSGRRTSLARNAGRGPGKIVMAYGMHQMMALGEYMGLMIPRRHPGWAFVDVAI